MHKIISKWLANLHRWIRISKDDKFKKYLIVKYFFWS